MDRPDVVELKEYLVVLDRIVDKDSPIHRMLNIVAFREGEASGFSEYINWRAAKIDLASWAYKNGMKAGSLEESINSRIEEMVLRGEDRDMVILSLGKKIAMDHVYVYNGPYQAPEE